MATDFPYIETNHYHYVTFTLDDGTAYNSYVDFGLYLETPVKVSAPEPNTYMVEIPGRNGSLDLTESAIGGLTYKDRKIEFPFLCRKRRTEWNKTYHEMLNALHGRHCQIVCSDDPEFYYEGRVVIDKWNDDEYMAFPSVTATVKPFKTKIAETSYQTKFGADTEVQSEIPGSLMSNGVSYSAWVPALYGPTKVNWSAYDSILVEITLRSFFKLYTFSLKDSNGKSLATTINKPTHVIRKTFTKSEVEAAGLSWDKISNIRFSDSRPPAFVSVTGFSTVNAKITTGRSNKPVVPTITTTVTATATVNGNSYTVTTGGWSNENISVQDETTFAFKALTDFTDDDTITVTYNEGWL